MGMGYVDFEWETDDFNDVTTDRFEKGKPIYPSDEKGAGRIAYLFGVAEIEGFEPRLPYGRKMLNGATSVFAKNQFNYTAPTYESDVNPDIVPMGYRILNWLCDIKRPFQPNNGYPLVFVPDSNGWVHINYAGIDHFAINAEGLMYIERLRSLEPDLYESLVRIEGGEFLNINDFIKVNEKALEMDTLYSQLSNDEWFEMFNEVCQSISHEGERLMSDLILENRFDTGYASCIEQYYGLANLDDAKLVTGNLEDEKKFIDELIDKGQLLDGRWYSEEVTQRPRYHAAVINKEFADKTFGKEKTL